jgi:hypothetical protein
MKAFRFRTPNLGRLKESSGTPIPQLTAMLNLDTNERLLFGTCDSTVVSIGNTRAAANPFD